MRVKTMQKDRTEYQHNYYIKNKERILSQRKKTKAKKQAELEQFKAEFEQLKAELEQLKQQLENNVNNE